MTLLDQISLRQPIMTEAGSNRHHKAHMRMGNAMERLIIALISPKKGERFFIIPLKIGSGLSSFDKTGT
jgi:hypothetical protein